jgi:hypothetical protein
LSRRSLAGQVQRLGITQPKLLARQVRFQRRFEPRQGGVGLAGLHRQDD